MISVWGLSLVLQSTGSLYYYLYSNRRGLWDEDAADISEYIQAALMTWYDTIWYDMSYKAKRKCRMSSSVRSHINLSGPCWSKCWTGTLCFVFFIDGPMKLKTPVHPGHPWQLFQLVLSGPSVGTSSNNQSEQRQQIRSSIASLVEHGCRH